jgi:hypothetical protein
MPLKESIKLYAFEFNSMRKILVISTFILLVGLSFSSEYFTNNYGTTTSTTDNECNNIK